MSAEDDRVLRLAQVVSDGAKVNWDEAERSAQTERERAMVRRLRLLGEVAEVHRSGRPTAALEMTETSLTPAPTAPVQRPASTPMPAIGRWGHLELLEKIGGGAFGQVFVAWDPRLERKVALKLVPSTAARVQGASRTAVEEGRLMAKVEHPNVVAVYGAEECDGQIGIWMELIRGRTLADLVKTQGPMSDREAGTIGVDLCRALAAIHRAGLVHRDIKAQNVMRAEGGRIVLMDFGVGSEVAALAASAGSVSGTPLYIAPEVFLDRPATTRSDLYSLGVLLYHLVTAAFPVEGEGFADLREKHARREMKLLRDVRPDLPEAFVRVVERALAWDPADRFATAGQFEQALSAALGREHVPEPAESPAAQARTRKFRVRVGAVAAVGAAAALAVAALIVWRAAIRRPPESEGPPTERQAAGGQNLPPQGHAVPPQGHAVAGQASGSQVAPAVVSPSPALAVYQVQASLYRLAPNGRRQRLDQGSKLSLGDELFLEFKASRRVFLYVIDEDEMGHAYALFPLPELELKNPLPANVAHEIPGELAGKKRSWKVDTPGGREHLLVLASPERLADFEAEMAALPRPRADGSAVAIPEAARVRLRGIGGLTVKTEPTLSASAGRLFDMASRLATRTEEAEGVWLRQIELENPAP